MTVSGGTIFEEYWGIPPIGVSWGESSRLRWFDRRVSRFFVPKGTKTGLLTIESIFFLGHSLLLYSFTRLFWVSDCDCVWESVWESEGCRHLDRVGSSWSLRREGCSHWTMMESASSVCRWVSEWVRVVICSVYAGAAWICVYVFEWVSEWVKGYFYCCDSCSNSCKIHIAIGFSQVFKSQQKRSFPV